jgi:hypothetical protein
MGSALINLLQIEIDVSSGNIPAQVSKQPRAVKIQP